MATKKAVTSNDLRSIFFRYFALQSAFSFERMQALGWTWTFMPLLKKLYPNIEDFKAALRRHLVFFNTEPTMGSFIAGAVASLEEQRAAGEPISEEGINSFKAGLMGPLAGVGDSLVQGTVRFIAAGVGIAFAQQGSILGPILFFLIYNSVNFGIRWYGLHWAYNLGGRVLGALSEVQFQRFIEASAVVALMVVGALVGKWLNITTPLKYTIGESGIEIQKTLDSIMPRLLPMAFTLLVVYLLRKGWSYNRVMLLLIVVGLVGGYFKIFG